MNPPSVIALCAIVVALYGLTACQPPTPRIAGVEALSDAIVAINEVVVKTILAASGPATQAIRIQNLDGLRTHFTTRSRSCGFAKQPPHAAAIVVDRGKLPRIFVPPLRSAEPRLPFLLKTQAECSGMAFPTASVIFSRIAMTPEYG